MLLDQLTLQHQKLIRKHHGSDADAPAYAGEQLGQLDYSVFCVRHNNIMTNNNGKRVLRAALDLAVHVSIGKGGFLSSGLVFPI